MRPINKTLFRDLIHMRGQFTAVAVVVAMGVAAFVQSRTTFRSLLVSQTTYYQEYRFADLFLSVKRAPEAMLRRIERIPGVTAAQSRLVVEVTLDVPGLAEPATGRVVSIPPRARPALNDVFIRTGAYPDAGRREEVLISEPFADANALRVGDRFGAVINGRWEPLRVAGIALSPEFIYAIRSGDLFPDNRRFGIIWMNRDALGPAFDMDGAFNDVLISLAPDAIPPEVMTRLDTLMAPYGGLGAYDRDDHVSHNFTSDEIRQNEVTGIVVPSIFLIVAAFLLHIVLVRLISTQRDQIALLKAFGYSNAAIGIHYLKLVMIPTLVGAAGGTALGLWAGLALTRQYADYYHFPVLEYVADLDVLAVGFLISAVTATVGALGAVRRMAALPPAEAMRPEPPATFRAGVLERLGLQRWVPVPARIVLRNIGRRPVKSMLSVLGIALAVAIIILGRYFVDALGRMVDLHFRAIAREDVTIVFSQPQPARIRHELARLPGVRYVEPLRLVPVRLSHEHRSKRTALFGLDPGVELRRIVNRDFNVLQVPAEGLVMSRILGELLHVEQGDVITLEILEGRRPVRDVVVTGLVDELIGAAAYMERPALHRLMRESGVLSGAFLAVDPLVAPTLYEELKQMPAVQGVSRRDAALTSFDETIGQSMGVLTAVLVLFASAIAVGMVYNGARISLSERGRELASMRVLGFTRAEVGWMLLGEQALLTLAAIPVGFALGFAASALMPIVIKSELYRMPLYLSRETFLFATQVVVGAAVASGFLVRRRLDRIDLVAVLKTRE